METIASRLEAIAVRCPLFLSFLSYNPFFQKSEKPTFCVPNPPGPALVPISSDDVVGVHRFCAFSENLNAQ